MGREVARGHGHSLHCMASAKGLLGQDRMDGVPWRDPPQIRGKILTCLPGEGPVPGTSTLGAWGRVSGTLSWGFIGSNLCSTAEILMWLITRCYPRSL